MRRGWIAGIAAFAAWALPALALAGTLARLPLALPPPGDVSGLAVDPRGHAWAILAGERMLLPLTLEGATPRREGDALPLRGVSVGMTLEGLAWWGEGRVVVGTGGVDGPHAMDRVLVASVGKEAATVLQDLPIRWSAWGMTAPSEAGVAGVCATEEGFWVVGGFSSAATGVRYAPIARWDAAQRGWEIGRLELEGVGEVAGMDCRRDGDHAEAVAVVSGLGEARVIGFDLPLAGPPGDLSPLTLLDLSERMPDLPQMEGVAFVPGRSGGIVLVGAGPDGHATLVRAGGF